MTEPQVAVFMLGMFIFLISLGFPVAFTLMGMGVGFGYYAYFEWARLQRMITSFAGEDPGSKLERARELGVEVIDERALARLLQHH